MRLCGFGRDSELLRLTWNMAVIKVEVGLRWDPGQRQAIGRWSPHHSKAVSVGGTQNPSAETHGQRDGGSDRSDTLCL